MGEFHEAVSNLLLAFGRGISIIKTQRGRRKKEKIPIDSTVKSAETHLSKTLRHNQVVVQDAYGKDLVRHGPEFAKGDAEAHSSLSSILLRLNAGFVSVIERFTRGLSTPSDYETLLSLSNASRQEAIDTFSLLSQRLSRSSLALIPLNPNPRQPQKQRRKKSSSSKSIEYPKHTRSKSAPELSTAVTPLGLATPEGWVRPKAGRKHSSDSNKSSGSRTRSGSSTPRHSTPKPRSSPPPLPPIPTIHESSAKSPPSHQKVPLRPQPQGQRQPHSPPPPYHNNSPPSPSRQPPTSQPIVPAPAPTPTTREPQPTSSFQRNRKSIMSFASDSTKLGEIPEHKWARQGMLEAGNFPILTYYPLEPYREPEKPRSRLRKLFRR